MAYREKDREFVRVLLQRELIKSAKLRLRIRQLPDAVSDPERKQRLIMWLEGTVKEIQ